MKTINCEELELKLNFAFDNNLNVIIEGKHGVGKTSIIQKVLNNKNFSIGKEYVSFSAATMDPWIDFLGIPKLHNNEGKDTVKLVKPEYINSEIIEVLFFDEFNRAPKRVRNAVMELIQFKSVNGIKFPKLKCIWAAINPDDESNEYDVEKLDPAQMDRFHLKFSIKDEINLSYFSKKFGEEKANNVKEWYESLDEVQRNTISPRRIQYALEIINYGGDPSDVLPEQIDITDFSNCINSTSIKSALMKAVQSNDIQSLKDMLKDFDSVMSAISKTNNPTIMQACTEIMNEEQLASCIIKNEKMRFWCEKNIEQLHEKKSNGQEILKYPNELQKKILLCIYELARNKNNRSAHNWAEHIISICVPGHKIVLEKEMTPKDFAYQAKQRYEKEIIYEWKNQHPSMSEINNFYDFANLTFFINNKVVDSDKCLAMLQVLESAIKMKKVRSSMSSNPELYTIIKNASQLVSYAFLMDDEYYGSDDFNINSIILQFPNIFKYLIFPMVDKNESYGGFKLTEKALIYSFIKS